MKKNLVTLILFFSFISFSQTEFTKQFIYKKISTENINDVQFERVKSAIKSMSEVNYELLTNDSTSYFSVVEKVYSDDFNRGAITKGGGSTYYTIKKGSFIESFREFNAFGEKVLIKSELETKKWVITNEQKTINKYICYKALLTKSKIEYKINKETNKLESIITEKELVAWFCPELPYSFGPDEFFGLPGLVFECYITNGQAAFVLEKINLNHNQSPKKAPNLKIIKENETLDLMSSQINKMR